MAGARALLRLCLLGGVLLACSAGTDPQPSPGPWLAPRTGPAPQQTRSGRRGGRPRGQPGGGDASSASPENETARASSPRSEAEQEQEEDNTAQQVILMLQRLNDRLTALQALDEQQIRKLESIDYRLTKLEVQTQEKHEAVRTELREVTRRVQQLDWQSSKMEGAVEGVRSDMAGLKHGQDLLRGMHGTDARTPTLAQEETHSKLQMLAVSIYSVRGALGVMQEDIAAVKKNVSVLTNTTHAISSRSKELLTTRHFTAAVLEARQHTALPVAALPPDARRPPGEPLPLDCLAVRELGHNRSGIYRVQPPGASQPFFVSCDLEVAGGGWTVLQQRSEGTVDFFHGWQDYKHGFGNIGGEFWIGLEKIHLLTNYKVNELLIELEDFTLERANAQYSAFAIGAEVEGYPISVLGKYNGTAGDSLVYHAGMKFSTHDVDHDNWADGNCAQSHGGAWWYNGCDTSNLNGRYLNGEVPESYEYQGMYWYDWHGPSYSLMKSRMLVRPRTGLYTGRHAAGKEASQTNHSTKDKGKQLADSGEAGSTEIEDNPMLGHVTNADDTHNHE
ncbi:angiopoietin-related protein 2-like [Bacillus rossius redtenbacheri]|uniref:angiopoietin-related protein 2-like n=1 Tax=Bacillus rossius redtenbacheri TaxID=93214 RepID=UPI002FDE6948